jgi:hypothetical protein
MRTSLRISANIPQFFHLLYTRCALRECTVASRGKDPWQQMDGAKKQNHKSLGVLTDRYLICRYKIALHAI